MYTGCSLKAMKLLDCVLTGICVVCKMSTVLINTTRIVKCLTKQPCIQSKYHIWPNYRIVRLGFQKHWENLKQNINNKGTL